MFNDKEMSSSFRDPSGFVFIHNKELYRQIHIRYKDDFMLLVGSGLYKRLIDAHLLIPHKEADMNLVSSSDAYKIIKPEPIPYVSYPYEWCFSQLRDAALATLRIQKIALEHGMWLKDCSAYNIQFKECKPILIDTLSFEKYRKGSPWIAYRQFCQHFLAPLALMSYCDARLNQLMKIFIDGIPLDLTSSLLPFRSRLRFSLFFHIHLHANSQKYFSRKRLKAAQIKHKMDDRSLFALIDNLESAIEKMRLYPKENSWSDYYQNFNYSPDSFNHKKEVVAEFLKRADPDCVWDLGANTGIFSRVASDLGMRTISFDADYYAVEKNYLACIQERRTNILPLYMDLANPSPAIGWENKERMSLSERGPADAALVLALIHHLAIANNLPFENIAGFLSRSCNFLIIEFIPKDDSQIQKMLSFREDIFSEYNQQSFEDVFGRYFTIQARLEIKGSHRKLYLMQKKKQ